MYVPPTTPLVSPEESEYIKLVDEDKLNSIEEKKACRRPLIRKILCIIAGLFCCGILSASISALVLGFAVSSCANPKHRTEQAFIIPLHNGTQLIDIQSVSGHIRILRNKDTKVSDIVVNTVLAARSEESLKEMELHFNFNETSKHATLTEKAKPFKLFHNCQLSKYDILLPHGDLSNVDLKLHSSNGMIEMELHDQTVFLNSLNVTGRHGGISIKHLSARNISASLVGGEIKIERVRGDITAKVKEGHIMIEKVKSQNVLVEGMEVEADIRDVHRPNISEPNATLPLVRVIAGEGAIRIKNANEGNIVVAVQEGKIKIKVDSSKFNGSYTLQGKSKVKGEGKYVAQANSKGLKSGTIGNGSQSINASIGKGAIKLKIE